MPSQQYTLLKKNKDQLQSDLMTFQRKPLGNYSATERIRCRAYITFMHAEIEVYFETLAENALDKLVAMWPLKRAKGGVVGSLIGYRHDRSEAKKVAIPEDPSAISSRNSIDTIFYEAVKSHRHAIKSNNGVKAKNFGQMFLPLGLDCDLIAPAFFIQLDAFGTRRGDMVHRSNGVSLQNIGDPFQDKSDVETLMADLLLYDGLLKSL